MRGGSHEGSTRTIIAQLGGGRASGGGRHKSERRSVWGRRANDDAKEFVWRFSERLRFSSNLMFRADGQSVWRGEAECS